jgi:hypothetical protein
VGKGGRRGEVEERMGADSRFAGLQKRGDVLVRVQGGK